VLRIGRNGSVSVVASGFTNIIDIQFDPWGRLYVLEIAQNGLLDPTSPGALIRVNRDGSQTTVVSDGLVAPGGLAIDDHGRIFVTNHSTEAGTGEIDQVMNA
jgi:glucose/arabinose dehydrogenase